MAELFGFNITRVKPQTDPKQQFSQPQAEDGTQVVAAGGFFGSYLDICLLYTSPSPRDLSTSRMPSSA